MAWNTADRVNNEVIFIDGDELSVENLTGDDLVKEILRLASEYNIGKFEILDANGDEVEIEDVETGNFDFPLRVNRENEAA